MLRIRVVCLDGEETGFQQLKPSNFLIFSLPMIRLCDLSVANILIRIAECVLFFWSVNVINLYKAPAVYATYLIARGELDGVVSGHAATCSEVSVLVSETRRVHIIAATIYDWRLTFNLKTSVTRGHLSESSKIMPFHSP